MIIFVLAQTVGFYLETIFCYLLTMAVILAIKAFFLKIYINFTLILFLLPVKPRLLLSIFRILRTINSPLISINFKLSLLFLYEPILSKFLSYIISQIIFLKLLSSQMGRRKPPNLLGTWRLDSDHLLLSSII